MDIKLIALDLDGTLLDSQKRLSDRNRSVLEECVRRGIYVVPCTGRIWGGIPDFIREFPGIRYAITTNGAVVEDVREHQIIDERKLTCTQALEILEMAHQFHTMYDVYVNGEAFGEEISQKSGVILDSGDASGNDPCYKKGCAGCGGESAPVKYSGGKNQLLF